MAQFGSALLSGSRGRRFKSCYSDVVFMSYSFGNCAPYGVKSVRFRLRHLPC